MNKLLWTSIVSELADAAQEHPPLAAELLRLFSAAKGEKKRKSAIDLPIESAPVDQNKLRRLVSVGIGGEAERPDDDDLVTLDTRLERVAVALKANRKDGHWFDAFNLEADDRAALALAYETASLGASALATLASAAANVAEITQAAATAQRWLFDCVHAFSARCPLQNELFAEVCRFAKQARVFVSRHMRSSDACSLEEFQVVRESLSRSTGRTDPVARRVSLAPAKQPSPKREAPDELLQARSLLKGCRALLVGGDEREYQRRAIEGGLGISLKWLQTRAHESTQSAVEAVESVDVVFLAIRWASHAYGTLADACKRRGIPIVRLPAGLNPTQIAQQTIEQAAHRLRAARQAA